MRLDTLSKMITHYAKWVDDTMLDRIASYRSSQWHFFSLVTNHCDQNV